MPQFRSFNKEIVLPTPGHCHRIQMADKPGDWVDLIFLEERTDRLCTDNLIHTQDHVFLCVPEPMMVSLNQRFHGFRAVFYEIAGLRGR